MAIKLIEPGGEPHQRREILVPRDEFLIGRGTDCDLVLNESVISRHHCLLRRQAKACTLTDLGSSNGTFLNGHRLVSQTAVKSGDELRVGSYRFLIDLGDKENVVWATPEPANPAGVTVKISRLRPEPPPTPGDPGDKPAGP